MQKYQCHKVVEAAPIVAAEFREDGSGKVYTAQPGRPNNRTLWVVPAGFKRPNTQPSMNPDGGDYLVRYEDGYLSWSPKAVFEAGYSPLEG
jgi:hypothetical protein